MITILLHSEEGSIVWGLVKVRAQEKKNKNIKTRKTRTTLVFFFFNTDTLFLNLFQVKEDIF